MYIDELKDAVSKKIDRIRLGCLPTGINDLQMRRKAVIQYFEGSKIMCIKMFCNSITFMTYLKTLIFS